MLRLFGTHTHRKTLPRWKQSRGERHAASSSTGFGTPRVSTLCWRRWDGLRWSNDARLLDCWCCTKSRVALHIAPPWKPNWSPLPSRQRCTHDKQLTLLTTRTQYRGCSFLPKTIRDWNSLPMEIVEAPTLDARISNWKTTSIVSPASNPPPPPHFTPTSPYSIPRLPPPPPLHPLPPHPLFWFLSSYAGPANTPSYRRKNNRHVDWGLLI